LALLIKYYSGNQIKRNEIGGSCGTYGGEKTSIQFDLRHTDVL